MGIIYEIENKINGHCYIGMTTQTFRERKRQHKKDIARNTHFYIYRAFKKYGWDSFNWKIIGTSENIDILKEMEKTFISYYKGIGIKLYNLTDGGEGTFGYHHTQETKQRLSQLKRKKIDEKEIVSLYLEGKTLYEIAEKMGCSIKIVWSRLIENNIKIRNSRDSRRGRGLFGFTGGYFSRKNTNPWNRVWQASLRINNKKIFFGYFEDPLSCNIVYDLVKEEIYKGEIK